MPQQPIFCMHAKGVWRICADLKTKHPANIIIIIIIIASMPHTPQESQLPKLVQSNGDVTPHPGSQVDFGLEVELDAQEQRRVLELAVLINGTLDELAGLFVENRVGARHDSTREAAIALGLGFVVANGGGVACAQSLRVRRIRGEETYADILAGIGLGFGGIMSKFGGTFTGLEMGDGFGGSESALGAVSTEWNEDGRARATSGAAARAGERGGLKGWTSKVSVFAFLWPGRSFDRPLRSLLFLGASEEEEMLASLWVLRVGEGSRCVLRVGDGPLNCRSPPSYIYLSSLFLPMAVSLGLPEPSSPFPSTSYIPSHPHLPARYPLG